MTKLVTFGETMVSYNATYVGPLDPHVDGPYEVYCAGAESNVCLDLERLDVPGLETVWISKLGMDAEGDAILRSLHGRTTVVAPQVQENPSGIAYVNHMQDGSIVKSYRRKGSAASTLGFDEVRPHLAGADALHVTGITPRPQPGHSRHHVPIAGVLPTERNTRHLRRELPLPHLGPARSASCLR